MEQAPEVLPPKVRIDRGEMFIDGDKICVKEISVLHKWYNNNNSKRLEYEAGIRLFADAYYGGIIPRGSPWIKERVDGSSGTGGSERMMQARERFYLAMDGLSTGLKNIIWSIVIEDNNLNTLNCRKGDGGKLLSLALEQLVHNYGWK